MKIFQALFLILLSAGEACCEDSVEAIVRKIDELYRSGSSKTKIEMKITTPNWQRTLLLDAWSKGKTRTFIRILSPKKERNTSTLRIKNQMWNFLPNINKTIKIPPSMMMSSWMGSDFTNDDLVKESSMVDDYWYKIVHPPGEKQDLYYIELIPKEDKPIVWAKIIAAVRKSDYIPVRYDYYDERGNLARYMEFKNIRSYGGRFMPSILEMTNTNKPGNKTIINYLEAHFDIDIPDGIFSIRNLRLEDF